MGPEKIVIMYSRFELASKYLRYYITASNGKGHGVHSPFVYSFIREVLNDRRSVPAYGLVEGMREGLLRDSTMLTIEDWGAGSALRPAGEGGAVGPEDLEHLEPKVMERRVSTIAKHAAKPRKLGQLLYRMARYYHPGTIVELGTSLGVSTAYLALGAPDARLWTIEGAGSVSAVAAENFRALRLDRIKLVTGPFDRVLPAVLKEVGSGAGSRAVSGADSGSGSGSGSGPGSGPGSMSGEREGEEERAVGLAFIDGNHRLEPTLRYFNLLMEKAAPSSVLIFDDIHWSREMEQAWETIRKDSRVMLTVDLFFLGMVFLRDSFTVKQDFVIRY